MKVLSCVRDVLITRIQKKEGGRKIMADLEKGLKPCPFLRPRRTEMARSGCILPRVLKVILQWSVGVAAQAP
jgi:hypothetical protein